MSKYRLAATIAARLGLIPASQLPNPNHPAFARIEIENEVAPPAIEVFYDVARGYEPALLDTFYAAHDGALDAEIERLNRNDDNHVAFDKMASRRDEIEAALRCPERGWCPELQAELNELNEALIWCDSFGFPIPCTEWETTR